MMIAVDPGLTGALALLNGATPLAVEDTPSLAVTINGKRRTRIDEQGLWRLLQLWRALGADTLVIEDAAARPGQSGMFAFGETVGLMKGMAVALGLRIVMVPPAVWKKALKVGAEKDDSRLVASRLWPECAIWWPNKGHHGRAEACLIGYYAATKGSLK